MALKYGVRYGKALFTTKISMFASVVLSAKSGRYVNYDESDNYWKLAATDTPDIGAYVEQSLTCSSTNGVTKLSAALNIGDFATEMPYAAAGASSTLTEALLLDCIVGLNEAGGDIYVSTIQYADTASNQKVLTIWGGNVDRNTMYCSVKDAAQDGIA